MAISDLNLGLNVGLINLNALIRAWPHLKIVIAFIFEKGIHYNIGVLGYKSKKTTSNVARPLFSLPRTCPGAASGKETRCAAIKGDLTAEIEFPVVGQYEYRIYSLTHLSRTVYLANRLIRNLFKFPPLLHMPF